MNSLISKYLTINTDIKARDRILLLVIALLVQSLSCLSQSISNSTWRIFTPSNTFYVYVNFSTNTVSSSYNNISYTNSGTFWVSGNNFKILDLPSSPCPVDTGRYTFLIQNDTLKFTTVTDVCGSRNQVFANYHWVRLAAGIREIDFNSKVSLFPNPTSGEITVDGIEDQPIKIFNALGEELLAKINDKTIDLCSQQAGIYFIKIGTVTRKIIKH
jgi:hypothetical protein